MSDIHLNSSKLRDIRCGPLQWSEEVNNVPTALHLQPTECGRFLEEHAGKDLNGIIPFVSCHC